MILRPAGAWFDPTEVRAREAIACAKAGLPLFPLKPRSKVPLHVGWQDQATTDKRRLRRLLRSHPWCNLGIVTGRGIIVVDIDGDVGEESYEGLTSRHGLLPKTALSWTGGGGFHSLFRVDRPVPNRGPLLPGIDIRGDGGYIVAPPSIHPEGGVYSWLSPPGDGIATAPRWLLRAILRPGSTRAQVDRRMARMDRIDDVDAVTESLARRFPVTGPGMRNDQMNRLIGHLLGKGFEPDFILEVVAGWHARFHGIARTDARTACREAESCLASKLRSSTFSRAVGSSEDHLASCNRIKLSPEVQALIRSSQAQGEGTNP